MDLPAGWHREYEGRHGAEFFYEPRNLTVSVIPKYATPKGRASEKTPSRYVVRVQQLLGANHPGPLTLGERGTFEAAVGLARTYMACLDRVGVRSNRTDPIAAFTDVDAYDDDVLLALARLGTGSTVRTLVHVDGDDLDVVQHLEEAPSTVRGRLRERIDAFRASTRPGDEAIHVTRAATDLVWIPRTETDDGRVDGTLIEFENDGDADTELGAFLAEIGDFLARRPRETGRD